MATNLGISKDNSAYSESNTCSNSGSSQFGIISNNNMVNISKSRANGGKTTAEVAEVAEAACSVYTTRKRLITTSTAVPNRTKPVATLMWPPLELGESKESAAPTTCPRRMTNQNGPTSPSWQTR